MINNHSSGTTMCSLCICIMDKATVLNLVRQYKEAISGVVENPKVYLFGSYSKDCARQDSDIDVAVVVPAIPDAQFLKISSKLWKATLKVTTKIEPVLIDSRHWSPLYEDIQKTGIAV